MTDTVAMRLEKSRQSLLDLSTRNRLLSLPQRGGSAKVLNIYDELTSEVYRVLVAEGKSMTFLPGRSTQEPGATATDDESGVALPQPDDDEVDTTGKASRHRDAKLQTKLASDKLQARLLEMYYDARTFIEEQGVNILYLALGQLKWFDLNAPDKERLAPLILLPVALERRSAAERFHLSWLQEDASENLSLAAKLKADFSLLLPEFKSGDDFDPQAYLQQVAVAVASQKGWEVQADAMVLGFFSFAKFLMYRDLAPQNWPAEKPIDQQGLINALLHGGFPAKAQIFPDDTHIDKLVSVAEQRHVVDADSSQSLAIEAIRQGEHLVIQGPPGTGKSQTITNVIAAAVSDGKKVLFVSEKMAALEVVYRRLQAIGLGPTCLELHSNRSNKKHVLDELKGTRDLGRPRIEQRDQLIQELEKARNLLNGHTDVMHARIKPSGVTPYDVIGHLVRLQDVRLHGLPALLDKPGAWTAEDVQSRRLLVRELQAKTANIGAAREHPWRGVGHAALLKLDAERLHAKLPQVLTLLASLRQSAAHLAGLLTLAPPDTLAAAREQWAISQVVASAPPIDRAAVAHAIWATGLRNLAQLVAAGEGFRATHAQLQQTFIDSAWQSDWDACRRHIAAHGDSWLRIFVGDYRRAMATFKSCLKAPPPGSQPERLKLLDGLMESQRLRRTLAERDDEGRHAFGTLWHGEQSDWTQLQSVMRWMSGQDGHGLAEGFRTLYAKLNLPQQEYAAMGQALASDMEAFAQAFSTLCADYRLDLAEAFHASAADSTPLADLQHRLEQWLAMPGSLFDWMQYHSVRQQAQGHGLAALVAQLEQHAIPVDRLDRFFERAYYEFILSAINQIAPSFAAFDGTQHNNLVGSFRALDIRRIDLARAEAARQHYDQIPHTSGGIGPMGVLNAEIARKRGHMPLRKLFKMAGHAVQAIKPVFMMSPLSVAQFLEPGAVEFDMLVVDEASQIEPVDALGAIARCKQLVVVGDDRQLPPTKFFSRMTAEVETDDDDDESFIAGTSDIESVLSLCIAKGMPQMMLRWHYRSRHQSLIAVSNQQFYKNELFIVPSPYTAMAGLGLRFNHVPQGIFDSGATRVNREEAKTIAHAIIHHAKTSPHHSLGVAAFSLQQKVAIQNELELLRRQHPDTEPFFTAHPTEPFFIKNLENVQGDERSVIFISVAYARNATGHLPMRFGPVSLEGGERRLNVLISRAKLRCEVFSSITADDIDLERGKGKGVAALKVFLGYAQTGRLSVASGHAQQQDPPFEQAVKAALEARGLTLHPHVGIAGFFIDLAIVDDEHAGRYLLGIECDGPTYHDARSARDRDRLRQAVLEDHGWVLHRLWINDWFRQPDTEADRIVAAVDAAKAELAARQERGQGAAGAVQVNFVDRESHTLVELTTAQQAKPAYQEANFPVPSQLELHEVPTTRLAEFMHQVIDAEGPVHFDEVVARVRGLWGLQRAGNRIREALDRARHVLVMDGRALASDAFLDLPGRTVRVRNRTAVNSAALRKPEYLPPAEIEAAILAVLRDNLGGRGEELPPAIARLLGFGVVSSLFRELVMAQLEKLLKQGLVTLSGDIYRAA